MFSSQASKKAMVRKELVMGLSGNLPLTSGTSFSLRRSRAGKRIISVFSRCSAASPDTGLASTVGLSFAETHGATPGSGRSRPTLANIPAINWLCKCSIVGSAVMKQSIWKDNSFWLRWPTREQFGQPTVLQCLCYNASTQDYTYLV